jgi:hypothetical protein
MKRKSLFDVPDHPTKLGAYRPVRRLPKLCARSDSFATSVGGMTGAGIPAGMIVCHTSRIIRGKHSESEAYGELFPSDRAMDQFNYERGYLVAYFPRPRCWFGLYLPRATRKFLERTGRLDLIPRIIGEDYGREWERSGGATPLYRNPKHCEQLTITR